LAQHNKRLPSLRAYTLAGLPLLATCVVFWQGSLPSGPSTAQINDKLAHFIVFGGLAVLCIPFVLAVGSSRGLPRAQQIASSILYATLAGGLLEVWQATLPHRSAEWLDFAADATGAVCASGLAWLLVLRFKRSIP
jgi:VanZ family protein